VNDRSPAQQRAHDIGNALHLVNGAIYALDSFGDDLAADEREELDQAVNASLEKLTALLTSGADEVFPLEAAANQAVDDARSQDIDVRVQAETSITVRAYRDELVDALTTMVLAVCDSAGGVLHVRTEDSEAVLELARGDPRRPIVVRFPQA
jgi:hypothetical protein